MNIDEPIPGAFILPGRGRKRHRQGTDSTIVNRLPILKYLPRGFRSHFVAMCGEFAGTFLFLFFAFSGTQVANTQTQAASATTISQAADPAQLLYISLCFGFSLAVNAWVFFRISGGLFNPAVTLGMCLVGALPYIRGCLIMVSQVVGGIAAAGIVSALFPGPLNVQTSLRKGTSIAQGLFIEMFLTAQLVFTIFMLAAEKHKATYIAPVGIGLSLFVAELSGIRFFATRKVPLTNDFQVYSTRVGHSIRLDLLVLALYYTRFPAITGYAILRYTQKEAYLDTYRSIGLVQLWARFLRLASTSS